MMEGVSKGVSMGFLGLVGRVYEEEEEKEELV